MKALRYPIFLLLLASSNIALIAQNLEITNISTTPTTCSDGTDGTISFDIVGGVAPYRWFIYEGVGFPVDYGWAATSSRVTSEGRRKLDVYLIGVKDTVETSVYMIASVGGPEPIVIALNSTSDITCNNDNDGSISVSATGETGSYIFDLIGPASGSDPSGLFTNLPGGTYAVIARDAVCTSTDGITGISIINPDPVGVDVDQVTHVACNGEATGAISISPTGGTAPYTVAWTGPNGFSSGLEDISGLEAGLYSLTITDSHDCSQSFPDLVEILENPPLIATFSVTDVSCGLPLTSNDGAIDATVAGGSGPYSFSWTGPNGYTASSEDISGLAAGVYVLEVTDDAGCTRSMAAQTVSEPPELTATTSQVDNACFGEFNGSIDLTVAGGLTPYTFAWTGPNGFTATTEDISGLEAGAYSVTIDYPGACSMPFNNIVTINEPPLIQVSSVKADISCGGLTDGSIDITVSGGVAPYSFAWTGPSGFTSTDEDLSDLGPGTYSLNITDANACTGVFPDLETIMEPSSVVISNVTFQDVLCNGESTGSISIDLSGAIAPYTFVWTNSTGTQVSNAEDPVNLPADTYSLLVTDANSCTFSFPDVATISEPPALLATLSKTDITCFGDGDGSITVSASGGTGGYEYSTNGSSFQVSSTFGPLGPGLYTIWTRDANLCVVSDTISILEPSEILIQSETSTYLCPGPLLGEISINGVSGGTGPYMYSIDGGAVFYNGNQFSNLAPGSYQTVVMDATGCTVDGNLNVLTEPAPFQITSYIQDDVTSCFYDPDGRIRITAIGGTGNVSYSLDGAPPVATGDFQNLPGGTYVITLIDDNACTHDTTVEILTPPVLSIDDIAVTDVSLCGGFTNGALTVTASGGTGLREFSLDDVIYQGSNSFPNLGAGQYTVWVRDANGCTVSDTASIDEPTPVQATISKTDVQYGSLGSITISNVSGGTAPYEFSINGLAGPFTTDTLYTDLSPGMYHVIVRDLNGCIYEEMVEILDVLPLDVIINATDLSCFGANDGSIEFVPQDAEGAVQYSIDDGLSFGPDSLFENLPGDSTYMLVALDAAGKLFTGSIYIAEPAEILFSQITSPAECNAFSPTGAINITVSGGAGGFTYLWSDGSTQEDRSNILAGVYNLLITDSNNCTRNETVTVGSLITVLVDAGEDVTVCAEETVQLQGSGVGSVAWDPSPYLSDTSILDPVVSGLTGTSDFILTISETTSPFGCYNKDTVSVSIYPSMGLQVIEDTFVIEGYSIQLVTSGGPFDSFRWEPATGLDNSSLPDPVATPLVSTQYYVFATNSYGCEEVDSVFIEVLEDIDAYNVFTPNGDGINDYFEIRNAERFPELLVEVYSRWGDQLYSGVGYDSGSRWDGTTSNGKEVPVGTYYYILIPFPGAKPITGNVTIIR